MSVKNQLRIVLAISASLYIASTQAAADVQQVETPDSLQEVTVTAQRRVQNAQRVPIAISAFTSAEIANNNWQNVGDLQEEVPSLNVGGISTSRPFIAIRGIGTFGFGIGEEGVVGLYVDGVYVPQFTSLLSSFLDLERIEILRGPQGTLYGRNTIAGAINLITKQPTDQVAVKVQADVGNFNMQRYAASLSGPLVQDKLYALIAVGYSTEDGMQTNTLTGKSDGTFSNTVHANLLYDINDDVTFNLIAYYANDGQRAWLAQPSFPAGTIYLVGPQVTPARINAVIAQSAAQFSDPAFVNGGAADKFSSVNGKLVANLPQMTITSITGFRDDHSGDSRDWDFTSLDATAEYLNTETKTYSEELRFGSVPEALLLNRLLTWTVGTYLYRESGNQTNAYTYGPDSLAAYNNSIVNGVPIDTPGQGDLFDTNLTTDSFAFFGQATLALTKKLSLMAGARYTHDKKDFLYSADTTDPNASSFIPGTSFGFPEVIEYGSTNPAVTLNYSLTDSAMTYLTYGTGFKAGAPQNTNGVEAAAKVPVKPEHLVNVELGVKSRMLDNRLQVNASAFHYHYTNQQVTSILDINGLVEVGTFNAASSNMYGVDLDVLAKPLPALELAASYSYLYAVYESFEVAKGANYSGNRMPYAPKNAFDVSAEYTVSVPQLNGSLAFKIAYAWKDDYYFSLTDATEQSAFGLLNLTSRLDIDRYEIAIFCSNCTNTIYADNIGVFAANKETFTNWAYGREFGVRLTYSF